MKTSDVIAHFGGRDQLADALGIDRTATYHWGELVPALRQYQIQVLTDGKFTAAASDQKAKATAC